jgi:ubiquitin-like modifier-activating enzyme ATG7
MDTLKFQEFSLHVDVSFWYELERQKLHKWRLDEPTVTLSGWLPTASRLKNQVANVVAVSADSIIEGSKPPAYCGPVTGSLKNFNTIEQLVGLDKKLALQEQGSLVLKAIEFGDWSALNRISVFTFSDLKTHKFSYIAAFPVVDLGVPMRSKKPVPASSVLSPEGLRAAVSFASNSNAPFVLSGAASHPLGKDTAADESAFIGFSDTSTLADYPGWALRNIIAALRLTFPKRTHYRFLAVRDTADGESSLVFECECDPLEEEKLKNGLSGYPTKSLGWVETKIRAVEMGAQMDPVKLADSSANLNLGLMKWRMMPDIELEGLQGCKALLLGSGTLGCNVARNLMMWGVRHITFVDRGQVSYSNPVRQTLFELKDCLAEGQDRVKSIAAANALKRILPSMNTTGVELTIRMPGHRVDDAHRQAAIDDITKLEDLIKAHDVTYLLTDSRESRWLPTLLATANDKPVINSALGFDSYVVMRHGLPSQPANTRVGCYFCNDVVAPIDSLTARTLDQQCTVTRPGVSGIASALAVELLASLYNHPQKFLAGAHKVDDETSEISGILGLVPHQVRGSVSDYSAMTLYGPNYTMCTACSEVIVSKYKAEGVNFIIECLNRPELMEEVTGLKAEREKAKEKYANWDDADFDDE